MKHPSIALLGIFVLMCMTSSSSLHAALSVNHLIISSVGSSTSAPGVVTGSQMVEIERVSAKDDELTDEAERELKEEEMRRLYLKILLMKGIAN